VGADKFIREIKMDKEIMLLQNRINELELENCEAQHKIEELEHEILKIKKDEDDMVSTISTVIAMLPLSIKDLLKGC
jgi:predicted transposase YdaD